ncbi:MAG: DUF2752 domain-containing protein [Candidatus Syntrophosphaera sp.]
MRFQIEKLAERFPAGKLPVVLFYALFVAYLGIHFILEARFRLCWFRALTGINCPTCGLSRSFIVLFGGRFIQALYYNPFMLIFTLFVILQQTSTLLFKRRLTLDATPGERRILLVVFFSLFALNWLHVILHVG